MHESGVTNKTVWLGSPSRSDWLEFSFFHPIPPLLSPIHSIGTFVLKYFPPVKYVGKFKAPENAVRFLDQIRGGEL